MLNFNIQIKSFVSFAGDYKVVTRFLWWKETTYMLIIKKITWVSSIEETWCDLVQSKEKRQFLATTRAASLQKPRIQLSRIRVCEISWDNPDSSHEHKFDFHTSQAFASAVVIFDLAPVYHLSHKYLIYSPSRAPRVVESLCYILALIGFAL